MASKKDEVLICSICFQIANNPPPKSEDGEYHCLGCYGVLRPGTTEEAPAPPAAAAAPAQDDKAEAPK